MIATHSTKKTGNNILTCSLCAGVTCRKNAPCAKKCYALRGKCALHNRAGGAWYNNTIDALNDPRAAVMSLLPQIKNDDLIFRRFRWFVSGDIPNAEFFAAAVELARKCRETKFFMPTKKFEIVNKFIDEGGKIPKNLCVVLSAWGDGFRPENPHKLPVAEVLFAGETPQKYGATEADICAGSCENCKKCWNLKKNEKVVFKLH